MTFNRLTLFLVGLGLMLALYAVQRVTTYRESEFTHGILLCTNPDDLKLYEAEMELHYYVGMKEYVTHETMPTQLANRQVVVRYKEKNPEKGKLYIPADFWFLSMLWLLFPTMVWGAFVFTILNEDGRLKITLKKS